MNSALLLADAANATAGTFFGLGIFGLIVAMVLFVFSEWMFIDALTMAEGHRFDGASFRRQLLEVS